MTHGSTATNYSVEECVADIKRDLEQFGFTEEGLKSLGGWLQHLVAQGNLVSEEEMAEPLQGMVQRPLYAHKGDSLYLVLVRFPGTNFDAIHEHGTWGVICVGKGKDDHIRWRRLDDRSQSGKAEIEPYEHTVINESEFIYWTDPDDNIHSHHGPIGSRGWELVLLGRDQRRFPRPEYLPKKRAVIEHHPELP